VLEEGYEVKGYTLKQRLGAGAYGEVWLAEKRVELTNEAIPYALKFLSTHTRGVTTEGVKNEVSTWVRAGQHLNIVSVCDGFIEGSFLVIVSEYVDGGSLREWLESNNGKAPSLKAAIEMIQGILGGLTHLHGRKIIHRDLKPENILLKGGIPKITDFGVSRMVETLSQSAALRPTKGAGSPAYMPPEAFNDCKPKPQLDTWSAGVMLYELLSGSRPFNGSTLLAMFGEITNKEPKPLPSDVPQQLQEIVATSLVKDSSGRFQTAEGMRCALAKACAKMGTNWDLATIIETQATIIETHAEQERPAEIQREEEWRKVSELLHWLGFAIIVLGAILAVVKIIKSGRLPPQQGEEPPPAAEAYFKRGKECDEKRDYDCAIDNYTKAIEAYSLYTDAYYNRGLAHAHRFSSKDEYYIEALSDNDRASALSHYHTGLKLYNWIAYRDRKADEDKGADGKTLAERDKQAYPAGENIIKAIEEYTKATEIEKRDATFFEALAYAYLAKHDYDKATETFQKSNGLNNYRRARDDINKGHFNLALMELNQAIGLNPKDEELYNQRAVVYKNLGLTDLAEADRRKYEWLRSHPE
jgi:serine/threonine protein kinase